MEEEVDEIVTLQLIHYLIPLLMRVTLQLIHYLIPIRAYRRMIAMMIAIIP